MDTDLNGKISYIGKSFYLEFLAANIPKDIYSKDKNIKEIFCILDHSNKGYIELNDLLSYFKSNLQFCNIRFKLRYEVV